MTASAPTRARMRIGGEIVVVTAVLSAGSRRCLGLRGTLYEPRHGTLDRYDPASEEKVLAWDDLNLYGVRHGERQYHFCRAIRTDENGARAPGLWRTTEVAFACVGSVSRKRSVPERDSELPGHTVTTTLRSSQPSKYRPTVMVLNRTGPPDPQDGCLRALKQGVRSERSVRCSSRRRGPVAGWRSRERELFRRGRYGRSVDRTYRPGWSRERASTSVRLLFQNRCSSRAGRNDPGLRSMSTEPSLASSTHRRSSPR